MTDRLKSLAQPFRERYLTWTEITTQLRAWCDAFPSLARVETLGVTDEGRDLVVLVIGPAPERKRPALWVDGNMHASELCGSSVALGIAEDMLRLHVQPDAAPHGLPAVATEVLRDVLVYVMPRMSPDGAETLLDSGRFVRSSPRDTRERQGAYWVGGDLDGDGQSLSMRVPDPAGEFASLPGHPDVLRPRRIEDEGPFYRLYPEGTIANFDGETIPDPNFLSDNATDLNRNFPFAWRPEPTQAGAGAFPLSEPESRAVVSWVSEHPEIFAWLNLHCFGGVFIRPAGDMPDNKMHPDELALCHQLGEWAEQLTGYPAVSGFEEFTYSPETPIYGDLIAWTRQVRGAFSWVVELWDLFTLLEMPRPKRFVDLYFKLGDAELTKLVAFDKAHNAGRMFPAWKRFTHPQLGDVEVGGFAPLIGLWNPPYERIAEVCEAQSAVTLRVAAMAPRLQLTVDVVEGLADGATTLDITVTNTGYLPTYVLPLAKELPWCEPPHLEVTVDGDATLIAPSALPLALGHLEGWGRGKNHPSQGLFFPRSRGSSNQRRVRAVVAGSGTVTVRVGCARAGWVEREIAL